MVSCKLWQTLAVFSLTLIIVVKGVTITFPVGVSAPPGFFPYSSSWGACDSTTEGAHGYFTSNKDCVIKKLKDDYEFSEDDAEELLRYATQEVGARPPTARGEASIADEDSKKALCKAASDCSCSISLDWCKKYKDD